MSNIALGLYKYVDGVNDTPFPSSANQAFLVDWQYGARRMGGAPSITGGTINHTICLDNDWSMDVYVEYKGEKFFPSHKPTSSYSAQSITYEHKVDFYSERLVLDNAYFYDVVSSGDSGGKPVSNSTKFTFFGNITEFIARLNASMQRANTGYSAVLDSNQANADLEKQIKFDTKYISEALQEGFKAFGIPYYFVGKVCHYGDSQSSAIDNIVFEYGKDNSLMSIEKTNANTKIVNRITGVGSGDNIPYYYPNSCEQGVVDIANLSSSTITNLEIFDDMLFAKKVKRDAVLTYNMWSFNVDTPIFYLDGKPYTNGKGFSSDEIAQGQTLHVVVPFEVKYDGCTDLFMRFSVRPVATAISNLSLSPAISGVTPTADNGMVYVNALNKNIAKGKYQLAFDVNISTFSLILQVFQTEACTIYANGWKDNKDDNFYGDLEEIGIMMTGTASAGDNFKQIISKYIPPQSNLMPSIYRDSDGDERFYNATNNTYVNPDTGEYYEFPNPYANGKPKEFIKDYKDVKPTIAGAVNSASEPIDQIIKFAYDENDNDDLEEDGVTYKHPYFFALLHRTNGTYGFNLFDHTIDEGEMSLSFTSGRMGGCEFVIGVGEDSQKNLVQIALDGNLQPQLDEDGHPILVRDAETGDVICGREGQGKQIPQEWQNDTRRNEVWVALKKDSTTYGVIMPNATNNYRPSDDEVNEFVILHIDLPKAYILAAEQSIDNLLISYMAESNTEHWNFGIDFSRIYLKDTPNIANALDENKKIKIRYNGEIYSRYVLGYTYKTLIGEPLPSISIELAESLEGSTSALDTAINEINNMVEQQANAMIGYQQIARLARGALQTSNVEGAGSSTRPIYFDGHEAKVIDGLDVPESIRTQKNVEAMWGVSAMGIANMAISGGGHGTLTQIQIAGVPLTDSNGIVNIPLASQNVGGNGIMSYTDKLKLDGISPYAQVNVLESVKVNGTALTITNKAVDVPVPTALSQLTDDATHRLVTDTLIGRWNGVYNIVPAAAYNTGNELADKAFVNSSVATATATFRGTNTTATTESAFLVWANGLTHDLNDYVFWQTTDSVGNVVYKRYKYDGTQWAFEYDLNNSSFTADQWAAINSGITGSLVTSYSNHIANTSNPHNVTKTQVGLGNVGNFLAVSTVASQGLTTTEQSNARANIGLGTAATHAHTDYVTSISYDSVNLKLQQSKGDAAATDIVTFGSNAFNSDAYAGGTAVTLNGTSKAKNTASFYAPTSAGTAGQYLKSTGGAPAWEDFAIPYIEWSGGTSAGPKLQIFTDGGGSQDLPIPTATAAQSGVVIVGSQTFGGAKTFDSTITAASHIQSTNGNIEALHGGVSAMGIANLSINSGGGQGTLTQIKVNGTALSDVNGVVNIPLAVAGTNGRDGAMSNADKTKLDGIADHANNYTLPVATSDALGGIRIGYGASGKYYAVQLDNNDKAYVYVPWENTTYSNGTGLALSNGEFSINSTYQTYISNGNTAYGWGNHAIQGYITLGSVRQGLSAWDGYAMSWGTLTSANGYNIGVHASSSDGGDWGMAYKNGQISMQLDGYYYQNEGAYRVLDTSDIGVNVASQSSLGGYLPLSGGTMTGALGISTENWENQLILNRVNNATNWGASIVFKRDGNYDTDLMAESGHLYVSGDAGGSRKKVWDEANDGSNSGLDADLLDGQEGSYYAAASSLSNYLPLTGGTLTGSNRDLLKLNSTNASGPFIEFQTNGTTKCLIGHISNNPYGTFITNHQSNRAIVIGNDGKLYFSEDAESIPKTNEIWHSGNDGSGSGLDADTVDGYHASKNGEGDLAAFHTFSLTGDTLSFFKIGTLPTVAGTGSSESYVIFELYNFINFGGNQPSKWVVTASSRTAYSLRAVKIIGTADISVGYVIANDRMEIWVGATTNWIGKSRVRVDSSSNFTADFSKTTTKPEDWVDGTTDTTAYLTSNVASATNATNDSDGNAINTTYLKKSGGTLTGATNFNNNCWGLNGNEANDIINRHWANDSLYNNANTAPLVSGAGIKNAIRFGWYNTYWNIGNIRGSGVNTEGFGIALEDTTNDRLIDCFRVTSSAAYVCGNTVIHSGNIGSQSVSYATSAGDADTLDSRHGSAYYASSRGWVGSDTLSSQPIGNMSCGAPNIMPTSYGSLSTFGEYDVDYFYTQLYVESSATRAFLRGVYGTQNLASNWHELAFLDSNVASATYATSAGSVAWSNVSDKPINLKSYSGSLASGGWATLNGRSNSPSIAISYNNSAASWNSGTYSATMVFGCSDTRGLLDLAYNDGVVTFGGGYYGGSTDDAPVWYWKLQGSNGQTYTLPSTSKSLAATDGSNASGTWGISITGNADTVDNEHASAFAHVGTDNNLIAHGNEFNFVPSGYSGDVYVNYRTTGGGNGAISSYYFVDGAGNFTPVLVCGGVYKSNYGSSAYVLTSDGGAAAISQMRVGEANGLNPISSAPDNATGNGYDAVTWYSWGLGGIANTSYACGITIGSNPQDPAYGFQIGQELWDDRLYVRRRNNGSWASWKSIAYLDDNVASATQLQTQRSIWGQNFNGTGDVSGAMTGVTNIDALLYFDTTNYAAYINNPFACGGTLRIDRTGSGFSGDTYLNITVGDVNATFDGYDSDGWMDYHFKTRGTEFVTFSGWDQKVGIGTTSPAYKLDVNGDIFTSGKFIASNGTSDTIFRAYNTYSGITCDFGVNSYGQSYMWSSNASPIVIGNNGTTAVYIDTSQRVGIGTTTPSYKLDVSGDVRATNFRGALVGNADTATALTTVSKTAWGQTFWTSGGIPASISGDMTNVGNIAFSASGKNIGGLLYFDITNRKVEVGTSSSTADLCSMGGVSAMGIASMAINSVSGVAFAQKITMNGQNYEAYNGVITLPNYTATYNPSNSGSTTEALSQKGAKTMYTAIINSLPSTTTVAGWGYKKGMVYTTSTASESSVQVATGADPTYQYITNSSQSTLILVVTTSNAASNTYGVHRYVMIYNNRNSATLVQFADQGQGVVGPADSVSIPANSYMEFSIIHPASNAKCMVTWSMPLKDITTM